MTSSTKIMSAFSQQAFLVYAKAKPLADRGAQRLVNSLSNVELYEGKTCYIAI
jgi:hypothetical protein